jgi:outer membrane protein TolC
MQDPMTPHRLVATAISLALLFAASGCRHLTPAGSTGPAPAVAPPPSAASRATESDIPAEIRDRLDRLTLADVVDVALRNSPVTRAAWLDARAAAARCKSTRGDFLPGVNLDGSLARAQTAAPPDKENGPSTTYASTLSLSWLLFNFGARGGAVESARQSVIAATQTRDAAVQDTILRVETAYFRYMATKSLLDAQTANVREAETNLEAAVERHRVGLATISDVLQARTVLSRARLSLETIAGERQITRGALALSMGLPANAGYDIADVPGDIPLERVSDEVEALIEQAVKRRPDLTAARAGVLAAQAHVREVRGCRT